MVMVKVMCVLLNVKTQNLKSKQHMKLLAQYLQTPFLKSCFIPSLWCANQQLDAFSLQKVMVKVMCVLLNVKTRNLKSKQYMKLLAQYLQTPFLKSGFIPSLRCANQQFTNISTSAKFISPPQIWPLKLNSKKVQSSISMHIILFPKLKMNMKSWMPERSEPSVNYSRSLL